MKTVDPIMIELDKERPLVLNMSALKKAERLMNKERREDGLDAASIFALIDEAIKGAAERQISAQFVTILIWAGVSEDYPSLSVNDVGRMIKSPLAATAKIFEAIAAFLHNNDNDSDPEGDNSRPLDRPNGVASGPPPESS